MLTLWRPMSDLARWNRDLDALFARRRSDAPPRSFAPAVDIEEREDAFLLQADLPGMAEDDIEVQVHEGVLVLSGRREHEEEEEREGYRHRERRHGSFSRSFRLGDRVDPDGIEAAYDNGVLSVRLPKREEDKPRLIPVSTN